MACICQRTLQLPLRVRTFSTSARQAVSLGLGANEKQVVDNVIPAYPYGPTRWYKQSAQGLYGGSKIQFGNNTDEKYRTKTRRTWHPNVRSKRLFSKALNRYVKIRVTTRVMRTLDKLGGLDEYLLGEKEARIKELGEAGWWLRWAIMQTSSVQERYAAQRAMYGLPPPEDASMLFPDESIDGTTAPQLRHKKYTASLNKNHGATVPQSKHAKHTSSLNGLSGASVPDIDPSESAVMREVLIQSEEELDPQYDGPLADAEVSASDEEHNFDAETTTTPQADLLGDQSEAIIDAADLVPTQHDDPTGKAPAVEELQPVTIFNRRPQTKREAITFRVDKYRYLTLTDGKWLRNISKRSQLIKAMRWNSPTGSLKQWERSMLEREKNGLQAPPEDIRKAWFAKRQQVYEQATKRYALVKLHEIYDGDVVDEEWWSQALDGKHDLQHQHEMRMAKKAAARSSATDGDVVSEQDAAQLVEGAPLDNSLASDIEAQRDTTPELDVLHEERIPSDKRDLP